MKRDKSKLRQEIRRIEESREQYLSTVLSERSPLRRGSFVTVWRKCGKSNCRCATGEGHLTKHLSIKEGGRHRVVYIRPEVEVKVAKEAGAYRRFRQARAQLAKLARQTLALIDELGRELETAEEIAVRKKKGRNRRRKYSREKG